LNQEGDIDTNNSIKSLKYNMSALEPLIIKKDILKDKPNPYKDNKTP
jgi:hypothetical protein